MALPDLDALLQACVRGQRVLLRADLNAPLKAGVVADDTRLSKALGSLRRLLAAGARVVLASHLGRPQGEVRPELSLQPVARRLTELLGRPLAFCSSVTGATAEAASQALRDGEALLLENLRFDEGETRNDAATATALARLAEIYVNDAFGTAHRRHASTVGVARLLPRRAAGDLLKRELCELDAVRHPKRPLLCLIGGAKVSDKLALLRTLAGHADQICIGGAMAYTFLHAQGQPVARSRFEAECVDDARNLLQSAAAKGCTLHLPSDHRVAEKCCATANARVVEVIPEGFIGLDIGPASARRYAELMRFAVTIFWNGPMGVFEIEAFAQGTRAVARALADSDAHSIVGGGDSLAAINQLGLGAHIAHLSTGGGAALEYIQGRTLPAVAALEEPA